MLKQLMIGSCLALFAISLKLLLPFEAAINSGIAIFILIAGLWLTETLALSVTALLVPVLASLSGVLSTVDALAYFAHPVIFIFMGGFAIAAALRQQQLDQRIAQLMLQWTQGQLLYTCYGLFAVTALLSMWISNMATTAIMLPLVQGLLKQLDANTRPQVAVFMLLGIAYCASIGGMATVVGSAPNAIAAAYADMSFGYWLERALPLVLILIPTLVACLTLLLRPQLSQRLVLATAMQPLTPSQRLTLMIFGAIVCAWVSSDYLAAWLPNVAKIDALIALVGMIALCGTGVVSWPQVQRQTDWGVLLLFGGGLCLSAVLSKTGAAQLIATHLSQVLQYAPALVVICAIVMFVVLLTEFASNTASAAILIPMLGALAEPLGLSVVAVSLMIGVAASCAFMLPVATPPNALVFGTGVIQLAQMLRVGSILNGLAVILISIAAYLFW